mmetsp:Transcript_11950/g.15101  ORF Transcript_11950/g.15101 Transcript_11950/m.15101 type:complete len:502 (-) Transcript_11950:1250-2755(-)
MAPFNRIASSMESSSTSVMDSTSNRDDEVFVVSCYSDFSKLAHGPRGKEATHGLFIYRFQPSDGSMVLLSIKGDPKEVLNPAFSRFHPSLNVLYTCTENIEENGKVIAYSVGSDGGLTEIGQVDAEGTSTCYLTIDHKGKNLLAVNYWDSTLVSIPLCLETGKFLGPVQSKYDPKCGRGMIAATKCSGGANHSNNDESTIKQRQADPHSHALVLDKYFGCIAYVPDLGKDLIREFHYDSCTGSIVEELNSLPSGLCTGHPDGPRYVCFHPRMPLAYVVNELSSTVAVFSVDKDLVEKINSASKNGECMKQFKGKSTLQLIQSVNTIPAAFPKQLNTCGRICIHESGRFVIVSNRGHQSIAILRVHQHGPLRGQLSTVGYFHTRGNTPRHFKFDSSGQYLIVANQDSDSISVFNFNQSSGEIRFTGNEYSVPSPNFICCCPLHDQESLSGRNTPTEMVVPEIVSHEMRPAKSLNSKEELQMQLAKAMEEVKRLENEIKVLSI